MNSPSRSNQNAPTRHEDIGLAFRLEYLTAGWMILEVAVAIWSGLAAHSLSLLAFGIDSVIELVSACVLIWRLSVELRHGGVVPERAEKIAARIAGGLLLLLALYVVLAAGWSLWTHRGAEFSAAGLAVTVTAIPLMIGLSRGKLRIAKRLDSRALRADAVEAVACAYLALAVVAGLLAELLTGAWWIDSVVSLVIVWFLVREGHEAFEDDPCRADGDV